MSAEADAVEILVDRLQHADRAVVRRSIDALVAMAKREPVVLEVLEARLGDGEIRWKWPVAYTLGLAARLSGTCLDELANGLGSVDQDVRWATQRLMASLGGEQATVRRLLLDLVGRGSPNQRRMAIYCLRDIGPDEPRSGPAILAACSDSEPLVRVSAVTSLLTLKNFAATSMPCLRTLADEDPDKRVRNAAGFVLTRLRAEQGNV